MTAINFEGAQSYTICLDSVDLTYLSKYVYNPNAEKFPLWTKKYLDGESEYCQIQIVPQDGNGGCYAEPCETYQCHICNVSVPLMCAQEHNGSEKHETIKKIYDKVLERVSKQINTTIIKNDKEIDKDVYYCVDCSKIIKIENKRKHLASDDHAKSKNVTNIINDFYKIFNKDAENDEMEDESKSNDERLGEESELETDPVPSDKDYHNLRACCNGVAILDSDDDSNPSILANSLISTPGHSNPPNDEKRETFKEYLKQIIKKYKLNVKLPPTDGENIMVETCNGDQLRVTREHFQSYRRLNNIVYCQMCKMWIPKDTRQHEGSEAHVRNIFKPVNKSFARTIDAVTSHCVPCNVVVSKYSNHHTRNDDHKKIILDTHTPKTFCEDCKIYIDAHNFTSHTISKKHINKLMELNSIRDDGCGDSCHCELCEVTIPRYAVKYHIITTRHVALKTNETDNNNGVEISKKTNNSSDIGNKVNDSSDIGKKINDSSEYRNKTNDSSEIRNKTNDSSDIGKKTNDSSEVRNKTKDSSNIGKKINNSSEIRNKTNDSSEIRNKTNNSSDVGKKINNSSEIRNKTNDSSDIGKKINDSSEIRNKTNDSSDIGKKINDSSEVRNKTKDSSNIGKKINDSSEIRNKTKDSSDIGKKINDSSEVRNKTKDSSDIGKKINDSSEVRNKTKDSSDIGKKINDSSDIGQKIKNCSEIRNKTNDSSEIRNKTNVSSDIGKKINDSSDIGKQINDSSEIRNKTNDSSDINNKTNDTSKINDDKVTGYCETCKIYVHLGAMESHFDGKRHKTVLSKLLLQNKNDTKPDQNQIQIGAKPDSFALNGSSSTSTNTQNHSSNSTTTISKPSNASDCRDDEVEAYYNLVEFTDDTKTGLRCKICRVIIVFIKLEVVEHMLGSDHVESPDKEINNKKIDVYSELFPNNQDADTRAKCEICDFNITSIKRYIIEHMGGKNHAKKLKELRNKMEELSKLIIYTDAAKTKVKCKICNVEVPYVYQNITEHMAIRDHAENAKERAIVEKMKEYSKLLVYIDDAKTKVRCAICDVEVPYGQRNIIEHMEGKNHADNVRIDTAYKVKMQGYSKLFVFIDDAKTKVRCEVCDVEVFYVQKHIIEHMEGKNHADNVRIDAANKVKIKGYSKLLVFIDDAKTKVRCEICDVIVPLVQKNIIEHMEGKNHADNVSIDADNKEKMKEYSKLLVFIDDAKNKVRCEVCDVEVPYVQKNVIEHMEGKNHADNVRIDASNKEKMKEYSKLLVFIDDDTKTKVRCEICDVEVPYVQKNVIEHMEGKNHADNVRIDASNKEKMKEYSKLLIFIDDTKTKVRCAICVVEVPYVQRNVIEHIEGRNHIDNAKKERDNVEKMGEYSKLLMFTDDIKTKVKCEICDVDLPYVQRNIIVHMEGKIHQAAKNALIKYNYLTERSCGYVCECCKILTSDYFEHINSRTHTLTYLKKFDIDKNEMRKYVYEDDVSDPVARRYREQHRNLIKYNNILKINDTSFYCGICQTKLGRINEINHVLGERHKSKIEEVSTLL